MRSYLVLFLATVLAGGCASKSSDRSVAEVAVTQEKPLFQMSPTEVDAYLRQLESSPMTVPQRVVHLGRKNLGQPYELYLLGEFPFENHDPQPLFCLEKSDCVVFAEHTYAMALSSSWEEFFSTLQRIRYRDGEIGVVTRNHFTEADWNLNNRWLVTDISADLAGAETKSYTQKVDRARFLKKRYKLERDIPVENVSVTYVPTEKVAEILPQLQDGDFVNVIVGPSEQSCWATHVGLVATTPEGERHFLHSTDPAVREEPFAAYIERAVDRAAKKRAAGNESVTELRGFKFLRLNPDVAVPPTSQDPG